ncbi:hypothetical protein MASR1M45_17820 [Candidatus Kapaibacterium sp.]
MKYIIIAIVFIQSFTLVNSAQLKFHPENPSNGDTVNVLYSVNSRFEKFSEVDLMLYYFNGLSSLPIGHEITLQKTQNGFEGKFVLPDSIVYTMMKIFHAGKIFDIVDNNNAKYWDILTYHNDIPVRYAHLKAALSRLGSISSNIDRIPDFYEAIKHLESELSYYPDNIAAELGLATTLFDMKKISKDDFNDKLAKISESNVAITNHSDVKAKIRALTSRNLNDKALEVTKLYISKFPYSEIAEDNLIAEISEADNFQKFREACDDYFKKFKNSTNLNRILTAYITSHLQVNKVQDLIKFIDSNDFVPVNSYGRIAKSIFDFYLKSGKHNEPQFKQLVYSFISKGDTKLTSYRDVNFNSKPSAYTKGEWLDILDIEQASYLESKAEIFSEYEPINAIPLYEQAAKLYRSIANEEFFENYIAILNKFNEFQKALLVAENAIINSKSSEKILEEHEELFKKIYLSNDSIYQLSLDSLLIKSKIAYNDLLQNEFTNFEPLQYSLESVEGTLINFKDLSGKIVIMNFVSSWCAPCQAMFPALENLTKLLEDINNVEVVAVNTLDNQVSSKDDLKRFIAQNKINFPIVRDIYDSLPIQIGIIGLPTTIILDNESKVRFIIRGFTNNERYINDIMRRVEYLLK